MTTVFEGAFLTLGLVDGGVSFGFSVTTGAGTGMGGSGMSNSGGAETCGSSLATVGGACSGDGGEVGAEAFTSGLGASALDSAKVFFLMLRHWLQTVLEK